jgi:hypothetical protein
MSIDCGHFFKAIGVPVQMVHGSNGGKSGHCWLLLWGCIEWESTALVPHIFFNRNSDKYHIYLITDVE